MRNKIVINYIALVFSPCPALWLMCLGLDSSIDMYYNMYVRNLVHQLSTMTTITATAARSNLFQLIQKTIKEHSPARISSKAGTAILISEEDYESILETVELMSEPGLLESLKETDKEIERGEVYTMEQVFGAKKK